MISGISTLFYFSGFPQTNLYGYFFEEIMNKFSHREVSQHRFHLQNPYAYLDQDGLLDAIKPSHEASFKQITTDRRRLQNQYSHLDGDGNFIACTNENEGKSLPKKGLNIKRNSTSVEILSEVSQFHKRIWKKRNKIWLGKVPDNPVDLLDPEISLKEIGFNIVFSDHLGDFSFQGDKAIVAGLIDLRNKQVFIAVFRWMGYGIRNVETSLLHHSQKWL